MKFKALFLVAGFILLSSLPVFATEDFQISEEVVYEIFEDGLTSVRQKVYLTNLTSSTYATRYNLTVNTLKVKNFHAWDNIGPLESTITRFGETTEIELIFNEKVAGLEETMTFSFEYQTPEVAKRNGQIWEINLPKIENFANLDDFKLTLIVPDSLGKNAYFLPRPSQTIPYDKKTGYLFTKNQLEQGKISGAFGEYQVFNFQLIYHLTNPSSSQQGFKIALPPDTAYQKIFYETIQPKPEDIQLDPDTNWLAQYQLQPNEELEVIVTGSAQVFANPQYQEILSEQQRKSLLAEKEFWPVKDPKIRQLSQNLTGPEDVYYLVLSQLEYDYDRIKTSTDRLGPLAALEKKKGLCLEFTDLFVTLARSLDIPARAINGYAHSTNKKIESLTGQEDILHAWPEYYDDEKQVWVPVDPTWGETTQGVDFFHRFDFNHLAFATHGQDSQSPPAAGSYKLNNHSGQDIQIKFGQTLPQANNDVAINFLFPEKILAGIAHNGEVVVKNQGNTALYNQTLLVQSSPLNVAKVSQFNLAFLPPFSQRRFKITLESGDFFKSEENKLSASLGEFYAEKEIFIVSILKYKAFILVFLLILIFTTFLLIKNLKRF